MQGCRGCKLGPAISLMPFSTGSPQKSVNRKLLQHDTDKAGPINLICLMLSVAKNLWIFCCLIISFSASLRIMSLWWHNLACAIMISYWNYVSYIPWPMLTSLPKSKMSTHHIETDHAPFMVYIMILSQMYLISSFFLSQIGPLVN